MRASALAVALLSIHATMGTGLGAAEEADLPILEWTARVDSTNVEAPKKLVVSPDDSRVFLVGYGSDFITAAYSAATGQTLWTDKIRVQGGPSFGEDIAVAPDGAVVYATGRTFDHDLVHNGTTIAYDASTGARLWMDTYDGPANGTETPNGIVVSQDGARVYVTMLSTGFTTSGTSTDIATIAYDAATGARLWVTRYASPLESAELPNDVALSNDGTRVYVTGYTNALATQFDVITFAYDAATGAELWRHVHSGPRNDYAHRILVPPEGDGLFVVGQTDGATSQDLLVLALEGGSGELAWAWSSDTLPGVEGAPGTTHEAMYGAALSPEGDVAYVSGYVYEPQADWDAIVVAVDLANGATRWWRTWAGPDGGGDYSNAVATGPTGLVHVGVTAQWGGSPSAVLLTLEPTGGELLGLARHEPGFGLDSPQHVVVSADGEHAYVALTETVSNSPLQRDIVTHAYRVLAPPTPPTAPLDLVATPGYAQAAIAWSPPADDGRRAVESYHLQRGTTPGGPYPDTVCITAGALACVDATLSHESTNCYVVTATNAIGGSAPSSEACLAADAPPVPLIQAPPVLTRAPVSFVSASTDADGTIVAAAWDMGDSTQYTGNIVTHAYASLGTYEVTLSVTDDRGISRATTRPIVVVNADPVVDFSTNVTRGSPGVPVAFGAIATDPEGTPLSYEWDLGDGNIASGAGVEHVYSAEGVYSIALTVTDAEGGVATRTRDLLVQENALPIADYGYTLQPNARITFNDRSSDMDGSIVSWNWVFTSRQSSTQRSPTVQIVDAGVFPMRLEVTDDRGGQASIERLVEVDDVLVARLGMSQDGTGPLQIHAEGAWLNGSRVDAQYVVTVSWRPAANADLLTWTYEGTLGPEGEVDIDATVMDSGFTPTGRYAVTVTLDTTLGYGGDPETATVSGLIDV